MAKRLEDIALKHFLISPLYFGDIAGRSTVGAAATLTHDIEKTFQNQEVVTALAFDIKGAFDRVSEARLTKKLWGQNIPITLIRWVASFLNEL